MKTNNKIIIRGSFLMGAFIGIIPSTQATLLHKAAANGNFVETCQLLSRGEDIEAKNPDGMTPLHIAAMNGKNNIIILGDEEAYNEKYDLIWKIKNLNVIIALLECGANVNAQDKAGNTPLHLAAYAGSSSVVKELLMYNANISTLNRSKETAFRLAKKRFAFNENEKIEKIKILKLLKNSHT